ncbi:DUF2975 domain-containing protein [Hyunsoonleella sp. SJ7]|uniref:DUF2975 domain-containing protein n=1 Tax=Hyunsoonleella aquatilis TaxID=2762758 RepID=A0A923H8K6_9FLAO|nr:DUF2975 domain-containing protein [Hyunsoonleella aquatilis]MBC3756792.1 DUF2975 domain-containing protein [Hyunsoonleella aquatilis]
MLKIFKIALTTFIALYVIAMILYLLITLTGGHTAPKHLLRNSFFSSSKLLNFYIYLILDVIKDVILVLALILLLRIGNLFEKKNYFTAYSVKRLNLAGKCFVLVAIMGFFMSIFYHYSFSENIMESMLLPFFYHFMTLIIGLGILVIEETQKCAIYLKEENDLTI